MSYKELLFEFLKEETNRKYCVPIIERLLQANKRKGKFVLTISKSNRRLEVSPEEIEKRVEEICEFIIQKALEEGYGAFVVPFIISKDQAPNFYVTEEKPKEEELWWWLYHLLTGLHCREYILNLANVPNEVREEFRNYLIQEKFLIIEKERLGLDLKEMLSRLEVPKNLMLEEFILGFIFVSYFAKKFLKGRKEEEEVAKVTEKPISEMTDEASLLVFVLSREKKKVYILPKLKDLISYWYSDFYKNKTPYISRFIFSLYIADENYREESAGLLNKFLYYFLQGYVNGELLMKLIELKISYELKKKEKKIYGLANANWFFSKL